MDPITADQLMTSIGSAFNVPLLCWSPLQLQHIAFFVVQSQCIADIFLRAMGWPGDFQ